MNDLKNNKKAKDKVLLFVFALILVISCFFIWDALWKSQNFRQWVCKITNGEKCYGIKLYPDPPSHT